MSTLVCFDIGNTNIVIGCFENQKLLGEVRISSSRERTVDEYSALTLSLLAHRLKGGEKKIDSAIISSVVPPLTPVFVRVVEELFSVVPRIVGTGIKTGIALKVQEPVSVGADRIVNAVAARELFGTPALVVDFGTATSFDFVNAKGEYEGGAIAPGPQLALDSLARNTAKLPRIEMAWPTAMVGKNTVTAMQIGSVVGYLCMVDGLIERIEQEVGAMKHIIATGGLGRLFSEHSKKLTTYHPTLTLEGLRIIANNNS
jgi:type III pantothenate kinase